MYHYLTISILMSGYSLLLSTCQSAPKSEAMPITLTIEKDSIYRVKIIAQNPTETDKILNTYIWQIPALVLEVQDLQGNEVLPMPAPMPDDKIVAASKRILKPGEQLTLQFNGLGIAPENLKDPSYKVRAKGYLQDPKSKEYQVIYSDWIAIDTN